MMADDTHIPFVKSLAFRFSLFFLTGMLIIFFIAFYLVVDYTSTALRQEAQKDAENAAMLAITKIENVLQPIQQIPLTMVRSLDVPDPNYRDVLTISRDIMLENIFVFGSCLAFEPYRFSPESYWYGAYQYETRYGIREKVLGGSDYNYFSFDWYRLPKTLNKPVWTEPYFDAGGGDTLMCTYSVPFFSYREGSRSFGGVMTLDVSLSSLAEMVKNTHVINSDFAFLLSAKGKILAIKDPSLVNQDMLALARQKGEPGTMKAIESMLRKERGFVKIEEFGKGKEDLYLYYAPVESTGWSFGLAFPVKVLYADLYSLMGQLLIIFIISVTAILILTIMIIRKFTRPIIRLVEATRRIGHGDFNITLPAHRSTDEISRLTNAFSRMKEELATYIRTLKETTIAKEKIESELNIAHTIQMGMLPVQFPDTRGWDLYAFLESARAVGGDFYDFFFPDEKHLCFAIGDVSGKGVPASLFMMVTRTLLRSRMRMDIPLHEVIAGMNHDLCQDNSSQMFVTFFAGLLDLESGDLVCCNAGHNPPLRLQPDHTARKLDVTTCIPLGIVETYSYDSSHFSLQTGEFLVLYTDGVTDAVNRADEMFGMKGLIQCLGHPGMDSAQRVTERIADTVSGFSAGTEQADDITILVLRNRSAVTEKPLTMDKLEVHLFNHLNELDKIVSALEKLEDNWGIPEKLIMELNLVLEELFTNIVFYAFDDAREHTILLVFDRPDESTLRIRIEDDGKPFNLLEKEADDELQKPLEERKIGGLGIHIVRQFMTTVEYRREEGKNIVLLSRNY